MLIDPFLSAERNSPIANDELTKILSRALTARAVTPTPELGLDVLWPARHFGLDEVRVFRGLRDDRKHNVLRACTQSLLEEALQIEKAGMYFTAKMALVAESIDERLLYNLFCADEATHYYWFNAFCADVEPRPQERNPFLKLLGDVLDQGDRATIIFIIQVLLEGWGIHHYHALSRNCASAQLQNLLRLILKDEARHHGSGVALINAHSLQPSQIETLKLILQKFFRMVQVGPQMVVSHLEREAGHFSRDQRAEVFRELATERESAKKLAILLEQIKEVREASPFVEFLEQNGSLRPFTPLECAQ